jgi:hypothetical protein
LVAFSAFVSTMVTTLAVIRMRVIERAGEPPYDGPKEPLSIRNSTNRNEPGVEDFEEKKASPCIRALALVIFATLTWMLMYLCATSLIRFFR